MHRSSCTAKDYCWYCTNSNMCNSQGDFDFTKDTIKMLDNRLIGRLHCYKKDPKPHHEHCCDCQHDQLCLKQVRRLNDKELESQRNYEEWWEHKALRGHNDYRNIDHCNCIHKPIVHCHQNSCNHPSRDFTVLNARISANQSLTFYLDSHSCGPHFLCGNHSQAMHEGNHCHSNPGFSVPLHQSCFFTQKNWPEELKLKNPSHSDKNVEEYQNDLVKSFHSYKGNEKNFSQLKELRNSFMKSFPSRNP